MVIWSPQPTLAGYVLDDHLHKIIYTLAGSLCLSLYIIGRVGQHLRLDWKSAHLKCLSNYYRTVIPYAEVTMTLPIIPPSLYRSFI